jgi:peptidoglycan/LPS O-acetylase OafA/YrhL
MIVLVCHSSRFDLGDWAVYSFFILSGYWIFRMWQEKYSRTAGPVATFYFSRVVRLLPVFWTANLLSALVQRGLDAGFLDLAGWSAGGIGHALLANFFILGYATVPHAGAALHAAWSLDVEMQFYLVAPLGFFLLGRPKAGKIWEAVIVAGCLLGFGLFLATPGPAYRQLGCYGLLFWVGLAAARHEWRPSARWAYGAAVVGVLLVGACWLVPDWRPLVENAKHGATGINEYHKRIFQAGLALVVAPFALFTVRQESSQSDRVLSELTYIVYLIQWPIMTAHGFLYGHLAPLARLPSLIGAWMLVGGVSWLVFRYIDRPCEAWRKRYVQARVGGRPR